MAEDKTIFAMIIDDELPSEKLYEDEQCIVIKDINPQASTHVLIIPKSTEIPRLADANESHQALLGHLLLVAGEMSRRLGVDDAFRLVINNGADAGQTVFHLHLHILASKAFDEGSLGKEFG
ncbi:MAG: histidine triad nucleotide-binding protein [Pseudomonadales bacterium]|nr:histidine triad nucleotide-binding protein [Pseudomonadales bacterium]MBO6566140.1 histidine triad nucleotide-binding protein [Pseudomonadales bacterium]MBO6596414.1 histidine triad nucleotide-binding protein [Pseudomonadales bacterium]MBO6822894.1 histidine triad nucleotide-binding protein [Pseudomonadales bacterium]